MNHMESPSRVKRWAAGVLVALVTILGVGVINTNNTPEAEAQGVEFAIATELAGKAKDVVCGEESDIGECAKKFTKKVKDLKGDMEDFKKCMEEGDITKIGDCIEEAMSDLEEEEEEEEPQPENPVKEEYTLYRLSSALTTLYGNYWVDFEGNKAKDESKDEDKDKDKDKDSESGDSESGDSEDSGASADDKSDEELTEMVDFAEMWSPVLRYPGTAGAFLGYEDKNFNDDTAQAFNGSNASNDRVYTHELARSLSSVPVGEDGTQDHSANNGVRDYLYFGSALNGLGLDSPAGAGGNQAADGTAQRFMFGNAMLLAFIGSGLIDVVFATVVRALQVINPFNLLFDAVRGADDYFGGTKSMFTAGVDGVGDDSVFSGIRDFFATIYQGTLTIGWMVTVPITIGIVAMGMLLFRRYERGKNLKHLFIRITYLTLGIPLLGVTYTSALNSMEGASGRSGTVHAQGVVLSTYVDFEKWAMDYRLAIPNGAPNEAITWFEGDGQPASESQVKVRKTALAINQMVNSNWDDSKKQHFDSESSDYTYMTDAMDYGAKPGEGKLSKGTSMNTSDDAGFGNTINLLNRYKDNAGISGATLDNSVTSYLAAEDRKKKNAEEGAEGGNENSKPGDSSNAVASPIEWISEWNTAEKINSQGQKSAEEGDDPANGGLKTVKFDDASTPNPLMYVQNGGLHAKGEGYKNVADDESNVTNSDGAKNTLSFYSSSDNKCTARDITANGAEYLNGKPADCNMSLLSLYNYLNTRFDDKAGTIDGSGMSSSVNSRAMHSSVSAVGSGAMKLIYWFSSMTLLVSFIVIGFGYALALLFNSIKRTISLISAVPFAAMGFMGGIAKVIVYAVALFLELLGTLFIYRLVQEFLMAIPTLIEAPMAGFLNGENGDLAVFGISSTVAGLAAKNPMAVGILVTLIASAGVLIFTILAMKLRSTLIGAIDEAVTRFINKLMDTNVSGGTEAGKQSQAKSMLARGAGMAVGHRMMTGGGDDGADGADGDGGTGLAGDDDPTGGGGGMRNAAMAGAGGAAGLSNLSGSVDDAGDAEGIYGADGGDASVDATDENGFYNPDGSEGLAADGDYSVQNGLLTDADGQTVTDQEGNPITPGDIANHDAAGNLYGDDGELATDKNGVPMTLADVGGVDENGNLLDHNGNQLTDGDGNTISANSMATKGGVQLPTDANGDLMDAQGATVRGEDGNAIPISSIGGFDADGNALDTQGNPIMDAKGEPVTAESMGLSAAEQSAVAGSGSGAESFGAADSTRADGLSTLSDAELANNAAENGALASGSPELVGASAAAGAAGTALASDGSADMSAGIAGTDGVGGTAETSMVDGDGAVADTVGGGEAGGSFEANPASYSGSGLAGGGDYSEDAPKSLGSLASSAADSIQSGDATVSDVAGDAMSGYGENAQAVMGEQMGKFNESMNEAAERAINSDVNDGSALGAVRSLAQMGSAAHESFNESGLKSAAAAAGLGGAGIAGAAAAKHGLSQAGSSGAGEAGLSGHTGQTGQASRGPVGGAMPAGSAPVGGRSFSGDDATSGHGGTFQSQTGQGVPSQQTGSVSPVSESRDSGRGSGSGSMNKIFAAQAASAMVSGALAGNQGPRNNTASQSTTGGHGSGGKGGGRGGNGSATSQFINSAMGGMQRGTMYGGAAAAGAAGARGRGDHDSERRRHRDRDRDRLSKRRGRDEDEDDILGRSSRRGGEDDGSGRLRGHFQGGSNSGPLGGNSDGPGTLGV